MFPALRALVCADVPFRNRLLITPATIGERSIVMSVSVCLSVCVCVCVCLRSYLWNCTSDLHQFFLRVTYGSGLDVLL